MIFNKDFYSEEIRNNYTISSEMKEIWSIELEILEKIDDVCKRNSIKYFADYGTLLGAVRHQGFIPWDDDIDISMLRDDYERFRQIASYEFKSPYNFVPECDNGVIRAHLKIEDERTSAILFPENYEAHQGIFVDIFAMDDMPDGTLQQDKIFAIELEMWLSIFDEGLLKKLLAEGMHNFKLGNNMLSELLNMPYSERVKLLSDFCLSNYGKSKNVGLLSDAVSGITKGLPRYLFDDIIYMQFENIEIPVPRNYDVILKERYGDYNKMIIGESCHEGCEFSTELSYKNRKKGQANVN